MPLTIILLYYYDETLRTRNRMPSNNNTINQPVLRER